MLRIERMTASAVPAVAMLEKMCFSSPWSEASLMQEMQAEGAIFLTAYEGDALCGYLGMLTVLDEGDITNVAVHPDYRRQGIGNALVKRCIEIAKEKQLSCILLEARESNLPARRLYELNGFQSVGVRKNFYAKPTENAVLYTLSL